MSSDSPRDGGLDGDEGEREESPSRHPSDSEISYRRSRSGSGSRGSPVPDSIAAATHDSAESRKERRYESRRSPRSSPPRRRSRSRSSEPLRSRDSRRPQQQQQQQQQEAPPSRCLGVFGMSLYTTERDLEDFFSQFGQIQDVKLIYDYPDRRSKGYGFIYFKEVSEAVEAKEKGTGVEMDGHKIRVDFSHTKRAHSPTPGVYMGTPWQRRPPPPQRRYDHSSSSRYSHDDRRHEPRYDHRRYDNSRDSYSSGDYYGRRDDGGSSSYSGHYEDEGRRRRPYGREALSPSPPRSRQRRDY